MEGLRKPHFSKEKRGFSLEILTECSFYLSPASLEFAEGAEKDELSF